MSLPERLEKRGSITFWTGKPDRHSGKATVWDREIRIENIDSGEEGVTARLKPGAEVDVIVEADLKRYDKAGQELLSD